MLKKIIKYFFLFLPAFLCAQNDFENQYQLALNLYNEEEYFDAITELKRLIFFSVNFNEKEEYFYKSNFLIASSYKMGGKFPEAVKYFTLAIINSGKKEEIINAKIEIIKINILRRTTDNALKLLNNFEQEYPEEKEEINYWRGWTYIFADEWDKAAESFALINPDHELKILSEKVDEEKYSVLTAKILSYLIPGAGQFYTGNYLSGILSLGWNILWGYVSINSLVEERIFDGLMTLNFLWLRFYRGNIQNAEKFAVEENIKITNKVLEFLQNNYQGEKP